MTFSALYRWFVAAWLLAALAVTIPFATHDSGAADGSRTAALAGCSGSAKWVLYRATNVLGFEHPACWATVHYRETSSSSSSLVDLSNQQMHNPCKQVFRPKTGIVCTWPLGRMKARGVLVMWSTNGSPGWTLAKAPGRSITVGGREAHEQVARPGLCSSIGGQESISVDIAAASTSNYDAMTACLRGPGLTQTVAEVNRMLSSASWPAVAVQDVGTCSVAHLRVAQDSRLSALTHNDPILMTLTNVSRNSCRLDGYPRITFLSNAGKAVPFRYRDRGDQMVTSKRPSVVDLAPFAVAYVLVNKTPCDTGRGPQAVALRLAPPGDTKSLVLHWTEPFIEYCGRNNPGSVIDVSPVEPSSQAVLRHGV